MARTKATGKKAPAKKGATGQAMGKARSARATGQKEKSSRASAPRSVAELRRAWIDFFTGSHGHLQLPSASLFPAGDPTLLFTSAGMVPFKAYFAGTEKPPSGRVVTIQKCLRTTDLESVGKTERHCSFFEMLGNFSFGDYFKKEAIQMAWQFSLEVLQFDPEKIHVTVYKDDQEAAQLWLKETGIPAERLTYLGADTNWWGPAGDSGACGPCTELYLDRGQDRCTCEDKNSCAPGGECDRFMEYWNLVFNQYHKSIDGKLTDLPQSGVDTGAGLERIAALLSGVESVYETDEFFAIQKAIAALAGLPADSQKWNASQKVALRVLADHLRASAFAIADGIQPGNQGRNYVIRRIIRRALMFARDIQITEPALYKLAGTIIDMYGPFYPELEAARTAIQERLQSEEERFLKTLAQGLLIFEDFLQKQKGTTFSGQSIFTLYDTYGFPVEMTVELLERRGLAADLSGFETCMQEQRNRAGAQEQWKDLDLPADLAGQATEFRGYTELKLPATVTGLLSSGQSVTELESGSEGILVLDRTPFYAEGGGQVGDSGVIASADARFAVVDTQKKGALYLHRGRVESGSFRTGQAVEAQVADDRRRSLTWHHSATHLLNAALRRTLGENILQTGSLVAPEYLRFDFSHGNRLSESELEAVETDVLQSIARAEPVITEEMPIAQAKARGALATFGEKYGQEVRVVRMGDESPLSIELCGGCHVGNTRDIGLFAIVRESSPGAGNRRIEARAGRYVTLLLEERLQKIRADQSALSARVQSLQTGTGTGTGAAQLPADGLAELSERLERLELPPAGWPEQLMADPLQLLPTRQLLLKAEQALAAAARDLNRLEKQSRPATSSAEWLTVLQKGAQTIGSLTVYCHRFEGQEIALLRNLGDELKRNAAAILLFGNTNDKAVQLLYMASASAVEAGINCRDLIQKTAGLIGGSGGGKPDLAQAGGKNQEKLDTALEEALLLVKAQAGL